MAPTSRVRTTRTALPLVLLLVGAPAALADEDYFARRDTITAGAGNAVKHNMAVHRIDPWPPYVANDRINVDGRRIQLGYRRYQANRSIPPRGLSTSSINFNTLQLGPATQNESGLSGDPPTSPAAPPER